MPSQKEKNLSFFRPTDFFPEHCGSVLLSIWKLFSRVLSFSDCEIPKKPQQTGTKQINNLSTTAAAERQ